MPNSDISRINNGDTLLRVDNHFKKVYEKSKEIWKLTNGYFDPTVGSIVNAYGFGPEKDNIKVDTFIIDSLMDGVPEAKAKKMRTELKSQILSMSPILKEKEFFMSDEFSLVDCCIAPILWRLPLIGIELQKDAKTKPVYEYMQRVFTKPCFVNSLSELEKDIRNA